MTPGRLRRAVAALGVVVVASVPAAPAAADPARPTDQRSEVTGASPALPDGVTARVVGGDAFLELTVDGHEVIVPDYARADGEAVAYLRFSPDGTVEENRSSVASEANRSRYGSAASSPDPDAEPRWEVVATDGRYAWHDHRIHWMSPARAPRAEADGTIDLGGPDGGWSIDLAVDGIDTTLTGRLRAVDPPPVWPAVLGTIAVAAAGLLLARRVGRQALVGVALAAAAAALATSLVAWASGPAHARGSLVPVAVAGATIAAAVAALALPARRRLVPTAAVAAGLVGWAITRLSVLTHAVLPTDLSPGLDRAATVLALGVGLAVAAVVLGAPTAQRSRATV